MLEICNAGTVEEILAGVDAKRQSPPPPESRTLRAMQLAADDAAVRRLLAQALVDSRDFAELVSSPLIGRDEAGKAFASVAKELSIDSITG